MFLLAVVFATQILLSTAQVDTSSGTYLPNEIDGTCGLATDENFGKFPFLSAVGYNIDGVVSYESDAILINRRYVITHAAFHNQLHKVSEVILGLGQFDKESCSGCRPVQRFQIAPEDVILHEDFDIAQMLTTGNEILLIRLPEAAVTFLEDKTATVLPICLPWNATVAEGSGGNPVAKGELLVAAWERRINDTKNFESIRGEKLEYMSGQKCKSIPAFSPINTDKHICAGDSQGSDVCVGRNGAPMFERDGKQMYLKGVASFGPIPCHDESTKGIPGVYASIDYYIPWLKAHLKP